MKQQYYNVDNVIGDLTDNRERKKGDRERDGEEQANYSHRQKKKNIVEGGVNGQQTHRRIGKQGRERVIQPMAPHKFCLLFHLKLNVLVLEHELSAYEKGHQEYK